MPFEFDGKKYSKASSHQMEWGERLIAELKLNGDERILDLGCGDGGLTGKLADVVPNGEVVGIDASQGMLDAARQNVRNNLRFELRDINDLAFESEFDVVFSNAALHWVLDHERLLENVLRSLKTGGVARFNFGADGNCPRYFQVVREAIASPEFARFFQDFQWPYYMPTIDEYRALVEAFAFSEFEVWGEDADRHFPDTDALTGWIDQPSIVPFLANVEPSRKQAFRDTVVSKTADLTRQEGGGHFVAFRRVNLLARK